MPFFDIRQCEGKQPWGEGVMIQSVFGERIMVSLVSFEPNAVVPPHQHPHEQMGMVLEGAFEFTIGDETKIVKAGDVYWVPSNVVHHVRNLNQKSMALDIFSPPREEYK